MAVLRTCGACNNPFLALYAQTRFCPSCTAARHYDMRVRMRLKKAMGREFPPPCARCGQETIPGHSYCLSCATIRRLDLKNVHAREARSRVASADFEAQSQRHR